MRFRLSAGVRPWLAAALLVGSAGMAEARTAVSVDLNFGFPGAYYGAPVAALPSGAVSVGYGPRRYWYGHGMWYRPWGPSYVIVAPPVGYAVPTVTPEPPPVSVPSTRPDPVIYPRNGQSAQQTEGDRQECNRWAVTQPAAVADASVFQRAVEACMDGRGYTMK